MAETVLVVGSGGREHALAWKLAQSPQVEKVFVAPGNGGTTGERIEPVPIAVTEHRELIEFAQAHAVALAIVGPDDALAAGLVDDFSDAGVRAFGPTKQAARIESSKAFAKELMEQANVPTAAYRSFTDTKEAKAYANEAALPLVVKASGLALGKGVFICHSKEEAGEAIRQIMDERKFGEAGSTVIIEQFLEGDELSTHVFCDGRDAVLCPPSQDHKRIYDGDEGQNTGGMGAVAPLPWLPEKAMGHIEREIVRPTLAALAKTGSPFSGLLYPGLIEENGSFSVLEFNARFGDPEAQCYMRLLETDLYDILSACADGRLAEVSVGWRQGYVACVVLASAGYPGPYEKGKEIRGIVEAEKDEAVVVFHAGTKRENGTLCTSGGRVLNVTAVADTLETAIETCYQAAAKIDFDGKYCRSDIGRRTLARTKPRINL